MMNRRRARYWVWATLAVVLSSAAAGLAHSTKTPSSVEAAPLEAKGSSAKVVAVEVDGVTCAGCSVTIRRALTKLDGVKDVSEGKSKKRLKITYDPAKTSAPAIVKTIEGAGFKARVAG